jgi:hypothetical protein
VNRATTIRRFIALIVIAGLVLAPVLLSVGATAMQMPAAMASAHSGMEMSGGTEMSDGMAMASDMECCPKKSSHVPDCDKDCPFMALCLGVGLQGDRVASLSAPLALVSTMIPGSQRGLDGLAQAPPTRPPKT